MCLSLPLRAADYSRGTTSVAYEAEKSTAKHACIWSAKYGTESRLPDWRPIAVTVARRSTHCRSESALRCSAARCVLLLRSVV